MDGIPSIDGGYADGLVEFIRDTVRGSGCNGVVIGLSGGIDSAVVTKLAVDALGAENVINVFMPSSTTPKDDHRCTSEFSSSLGTDYRVISISPMVDAFSSALGLDDGDRLEKGNISARCRMIILFDIAKRTNHLVLGTSNRSEMMMGYFTKFGDGACDVVPIVNLYKTQVRELARIIGIPEDFITKAPSAGLWDGQTDEDEMGILYKDLDNVLSRLDSMGDAKISEITGVYLEKVSEIREKVRKTAHKREPAISP